MDFTTLAFLPRPGGIPSGRFALWSQTMSKMPTNPGGFMDTQFQIPLIMRPHVIDALTQIRQEWEQAADGQSLVDVQGSVGLLFADVAVAIGLTPEETKHVFGANLSGELTNWFHQSERDR